MISVCNGLQGCVTGFKKVIFSPIALGFKIKELVCNVLSRLGLALSHASKLVFKKPISFVYKPKKGKSTNTKNGLVSRTTNQVDSINAKVFNSNALVNKKTGSINVFNKKKSSLEKLEINSYREQIFLEINKNTIGQHIYYHISKKCNINFIDLTLVQDDGWFLKPMATAERFSKHQLTAKSRPLEVLKGVTEDEIKATQDFVDLFTCKAGKKAHFHEMNSFKLVQSLRKKFDSYSTNLGVEVELLKSPEKLFIEKFKIFFKDFDRNCSHHFRQKLS